MRRPPLVRSLVVAVGLVAAGAASAQAAETPTTVKRAFDLSESPSAISRAEGAVRAADLRKQSLDEQVMRFQEMADAHAITGERLREVQRDAAIAAATLAEATAKLHRARTDEQRLQAETTCDAGNCAPLHTAYAALRQDDAEIAHQEVVKLDALVAFDQFIVEGHQALADSGAIDQRVVFEDRLELAAKQAERDAAVQAWQQLRGLTAP